MHIVVAVCQCEWEEDFALLRTIENTCFWNSRALLVKTVRLVREATSDA